jgi:hypothetical protein
VSIDTTFKPMGATVAVTSGTPVQVIPQGNNSAGIMSFRIVLSTGSSGRFNWGPTSASVPAPTGPGVNTIFLGSASPIYLELPPYSWFNVSVGDVAEITPGQGGVGG